MKAKRWLRGILLLVMTGLVAASCAEIGLKRGESQLPEIRVGEYGYEPYSELSSAPSPAAIDAAIAEEAFRRMGYQVVFYRADGEDADALMESGTIDCLWNAEEIQNRDACQWVEPYLYVGQLVVVRADSEIESLSDLAGKRVAVWAGSDSERLLLERPRPEIPEVGSLYSFASATQVRTSLSKGYSDAIVGYAGEVDELFDSAPDEFRVLDQMLDEKAVEAAFRSDCDPAFVKQVQATLEEMRDDGTIQEIVGTYGRNVKEALKGER